MTHDLLLNVLKGSARLMYIVIDKIEKNTFHAKLFIRKENGEEVLIDARPSDSIAVALRSGVSIFAEENVLDAAGVTEV